MARCSYMQNPVIIIIFVIITCCGSIFGQFPNQNPGNNPFPVDTTANINDSVIVKNGFFSLFKGKPGRAALYSLVIPSGGQVYNKKWWKVPIALGIDGGLTYVLIKNRTSYKNANLDYINALQETPKPSNIPFLKERRDYFRKWSEYAWIWLIAGHMFTVVDAYVDRHLMDFDISQDISTLNGFDHNIGIPQLAKVGININLNKKSNTEINPLFTTNP